MKSIQCAIQFSVCAIYIRDLGLFYQRLSSELGSGEFGVVRKGVWSVGGEER